MNNTQISQLVFKLYAVMVDAYPYYAQPSEKKNPLLAPVCLTYCKKRFRAIIKTALRKQRNP